MLKKNQMPKWYLEFSPSQNCFHIDTMENIQEDNLNNLMRGVHPGYVIIAGPSPHKNLSNLASLLKEKYPEVFVSPEELIEAKFHE
mgnify:CR=1 FL=1